MEIDIQHADPRLRRVTVVVLTVATLAAVALVFAFQHWLLRQAESIPTAQLILQLRRWITVALIGSGLCLLLLAGYAARLARRVIEDRRWPLAHTRVLRDTPIRRGDAALRLGRLFNVAALVLMAIAVGVGMLSWRLFAAAH